MATKLMKKIYDNNGINFNKDMVNGAAMKILDKMLYELDEVIKSGMRSLDPDIPLEYLGYEKLSPIEHYNNQFNKSKDKNKVDISKSTLFKVKFIFSFKGEAIERVLALPYVEKGGILYLSDAAYSLVPVLSEYVISSSNGEVFVRLLKDKIIFKKIERLIKINGEKTAVPLIVTFLYKFAKSIKVNDKVPVILLLFIKYGFKGLFKHIFNTEDVKIVMDRELTEEEINKYNVYESMGKKPRNLQDDNYIPHGIKFLVNKKVKDPYVEVILGSLIHTLDMVNIYAKNLPKVVDTDKEFMFWKILLGKTIFRNKYTIDKILNAMDEYLNVIKSYIDGIIKTKLTENNIMVEDFYDLIEYITRNFNQLVLNAESRSSDIDNRYIDINYYILFDIISGFNKSFYSINKNHTKNMNNTAKDINKVFNKHISNGKIYNIIKGGVNIALIPVDYSGDNLLPKITSVLEDQNRGQGVKRSKNNTFPKYTREIHAEDLYIGNILYLAKKAPSPRFKLNPFMNVDFNTGKILIDKKTRKTLDKLNKMLTDKFENEYIIENETLEDINL